MRAWILCLIATASGCQTAPVELPPWDELEYSSTEIIAPTKTPARPEPVSSSQETVSFDQQGFDQLIGYMDVADANYTQAVALALALQAESRAYNHLIDAGKMQREIAVIRGEQLSQERADHSMDNMWHRGIIVLLGIGLAL